MITVAVPAQPRRTVFALDSVHFTVNGVPPPVVFAAASRIIGGRTFLPLRATANVAGVTDGNIMFDEGLITLIHGDRIVRFTIGSRVMTVNGVVTNMDVAPVLVQGRTLMPVRWIATALGVPIIWDDATRTITITAP